MSCIVDVLNSPLKITPAGKHNNPLKQNISSFCIDMKLIFVYNVILTTTNLRKRLWKPRDLRKWLIIKFKIIKRVASKWEEALVCETMLSSCFLSRFMTYADNIEKASSYIMIGNIWNNKEFEQYSGDPLVANIYDDVIRLRLNNDFIYFAFLDIYALVQFVVKLIIKKRSTQCHAVVSIILCCYPHFMESRSY